jgi:hypothetical protein
MVDNQVGEVLVVAMTAARTKRPKAANRVRARMTLPAIADVAGKVLRVGLAVVLAVRGLAALGLMSYGAWLVYPPAGPITAGALLLADRLADDRRVKAASE